VKVFGIGMPKTGTVSLTSALDTLGFRPALHNPWSHVEIARCGSATDATIAYRFEALASAWPDAKFIYTERPMSLWLASIVGHYGKYLPAQIEQGFTEPGKEHLWAYRETILSLFRSVRPSQPEFLAAYRRHDQRVRQYFRTRPERMLTIDITSDLPGPEKWARICAFLDVPVLEVPFPHLNRACP